MVPDLSFYHRQFRRSSNAGEVQLSVANWQAVVPISVHHRRVRVAGRVLRRVSVLVRHDAIADGRRQRRRGCTRREMLLNRQTTTGRLGFPSVRARAFHGTLRPVTTRRTVPALERRPDKQRRSSHGQLGRRLIVETFCGNTCTAARVTPTKPRPVDVRFVILVARFTILRFPTEKLLDRKHFAP